NCRGRLGRRQRAGPARRGERRTEIGSGKAFSLLMISESGWWTDALGWGCAVCGAGRLAECRCYNRAMKRLYAVFALGGARGAQTPRYDLIVRNGRIVDGSGGPWYLGDIGIRGDTIAAIGRLGEATAATIVDARGLVVAPGFLDIHTHSRRGIFTVP